jgi:hypothetical protein
VAVWRLRAPCRGLGAQEFIPDDPRHGKQLPPPVVVELCPSCPVRRECEDLGRASGSSGWWGGRYLAITDRGRLR